MSLKIHVADGTPPGWPSVAHVTPVAPVAPVARRWKQVVLDILKAAANYDFEKVPLPGVKLGGGKIKLEGGTRGGPFKLGGVTDRFGSQGLFEAGWGA